MDRQTIKEKEQSFKKAYIENILLWMVMFIGFVTLFFFVVDYATIVRVKDNMDAISDYGSRNVAISGIGTDLSSNINGMKVNAINNVSADTNTICTVNANGAYQVIFITQTTNNSYKFFGNNLVSKRVVFNENNSNTITCTLNITLSN